MRGFADPDAPRLADGSGRTVFAQPFSGAAGVPYCGHMLPFHFDTTRNGDCVSEHPPAPVTYGETVVPFSS